MIMREEKPNNPSQKNKNRKSWLWPAIYSGFAVLFVGMVWTYQAVTNDDAGEKAEVSQSGPTGGAGDVTVETNASNETMKFPFDEALLDGVSVLQEYYDMEADSEQREKALLVFNQTYVTNSGVTLSNGDEPFEVKAALSGTVEDVVVDEFMGNKVTIKHADGLTTSYGSVTGITVEKGDQVAQGETIATTAANEWNPTAGNHLLFEVKKDGVAVNPGNFLAF